MTEPEAAGVDVVAAAPTSPTRSADDATPTSVRVAIVLYENALDEMWRCLRSLVRSVERTGEDPRLAPNVVTIAIGDCSGGLMIKEADLAALRTMAGDRASVDYTWFGRNLGHSAGCNALAQDAPEDALLFLNPDCYVSPRMLGRLLSALRDPLVAAVDARQIPCEHPKWFDPVTGEQSWASGACLLVRTPWFREAGGFDADAFPSYVNDVDLSWRLRLAGGRVVHQPNAVVFHDKRLVESATVAPTRIELYEGLLGRLLLATRFSREDVVEETIELVGAHGSTEQQRAVAEFERRRREKALPEALAGADQVAEFVDGEYGRRRF
ncbi:MAG: glycosyltransferase [Actinophytocola sp.]|uniref:glycosyltransferase n=1 Tax=Actinophytocola sp. TaxID=1872138 RepID=UPI003D6A01F4